MSANTLTRAVASPTRGLRNSVAVVIPKPILRRPPTLPLSPGALPFTASFSILTSELKSPHVHFPPTPCLIATFTAYSPNSYDRGPIAVTPNPLALPERGDRVFSPTTGTFSTKFAKALSSPTLSRPAIFTDDISGEIALSPAVVPPLESEAKTAKRSRAAVRFALKLSESSEIRPRRLGKSLSTYPRSPYPSAPGLPKELTDESESLQTQSRPRTQSVIGGRPIFQRGTANSLAPLELSTTDDSAIESDNSTDSLNKAFWQSVKLSDEVIQEESAPGTPVSGVPPFVFGTKDGQLWSPGLPPTKRRMPIVSPTPKRSMVMSPTPSDPFASFPSFSAVLSISGPGGVITYPPRAALAEGQ